MERKYRSVSVGVNSVQGHFDDFADAVFVNVIHGVGGDMIVPENFFLTWIYVAQSNVRDSIWPKAFGDLTIRWNSL